MSSWLSSFFDVPTASPVDEGSSFDSFFVVRVGLKVVFDSILKGVSPVLSPLHDRSLPWFKRATLLEAKEENPDSVFPHLSP